ncbi:hypothetical protein [Pontibacter sp. H249]|uniref:hypothetical protein n=1 Tax=Pontibacter sp. H249 TaxID=3133420 RepID=UPI0030BABBB6
MRERIKKHKEQYYLEESKKDKKRLYNLFDNVSEMTQAKSIAMGANNYQLTELENNLTQIIKYDAPNIYIGFRCIAEFE